MTLLIDGHNLIGALPDLHLSDPDDEWQLVQRLRTYAAAKRLRLTVVFDSGQAAAAPAPGTGWDLSSERVAVRFAPAGVEADALIVNMVRGSAHPGQVTVVTGDQGLAARVRSSGGQVRSAAQFAAALGRQPAAAAAALSADKPAPSPHDPGFADLYRGFVQGEKNEKRAGAAGDLEPAPWIERLYGQDVAEAGRAAHWLGRYGGEAALAPLLDALSARAGQVRAAALLALADLGAAAAAPAVIERLRADESSMVREAAAQALGVLGGPQAEQALQAALQDAKTKVRKSAQASLTQVRARRA